MIDMAKADRIGGSCFGRFLREERGATAIEYSVVAAGVAVAVAGAIRVLGANVLNNLYSQLAGLFG
jgi:Flp pilus assembly pilin Flp